jgi:hypothetical protein
MWVKESSRRLFLQHQNINLKLGMVVQACNAGYLGGRDQEDCGLRPTRTKNYETPPQPMAGHGGMLLSSLLRRGAQTEESLSPG